MIDDRDSNEDSHEDHKSFYKRIGFTFGLILLILFILKITGC